MVRGGWGFVGVRAVSVLRIKGINLIVCVSGSQQWI